MIFIYFIFGQLVVAVWVVLFLKKKLDGILIESAIKQLEYLGAEKKSGIKSVAAVTHKNLDLKNQEQLKRTVAKQLGATTVLSFQIDKSLMGGVVLKLGNQVIDCSLRDRLQQAWRYR